ncbi:MAG: hypothetical protein HOO86_11615 [Bacteroidales bacterium]|nr:hypothetical protein [Bacteroidales bacterium]
MKHSINSNLAAYFPVLTIIILLSVLKPLTAQNRVTDKVYLKNGTIVYGRIVQNDSLRGIRINNDCGSYLIRFQEFDSLKFNVGENNFISQTKGYYNSTSLGLLFGKGVDGNLPYPSITSVTGYQFSKHWFTGIGVGFEYYQWGVLPLFVQADYFINTERFTPYFAIKAGYSFPLTKKKEGNYNTEKTFGGITVNPEIGFKIAMGDKNAFICSIGYQYQKLSYEQPGYDYFNGPNYSRRIYTNFNRISFRIGFVFR